jgi:sugar lactone lactonase YvrE
VRLRSDRIHISGARLVLPLVVLGLAIVAAAESGMAQALPVITLRSSSNRLASAGIPFPATAVGSTSAAVTLPLQVNAAGTAIISIAAVTSQGGNREYAVTGMGCALNTALSAGTICNVTVTFSPVYPGYRLVPLQVISSAGTFYFGMVGLGTGPQVALTPNTIASVGITSGINLPLGMALDSAGNLYFADIGDNVIRKIAADTGTITTVAGNGVAGFSGDGGPAINAELNGPSAVALDSAGNLYIADTENCFIRRVAADTGTITTVVGIGYFPLQGVPPAPAAPVGYFGDGFRATDARMTFPEGVSLDQAGDIYIADSGNNVIREVNASTDIITTVAGNHKSGSSGDNGPATSAELNSPASVAIDAARNLYISDEGNNRIREVSAVTGIITTVAGNGTAGYGGDGGPATSAELDEPQDIALDNAGDLYIADSVNNRVRRVSLSETITTVAGTGTAGFSGDGGTSTSALLNLPSGLALDNGGNLYIGDFENHRIREMNVLASQLNFATTPIGFTSLDSPQTATVSNTGNAPLAISVPASGLNPSITPGFPMSNSSTCPQLDLTSSPASLASGDSCSLVLSFAPVVSGPIDGTANIADNALGLAPLRQTIHLNAIGLPAGDAIPDFSVAISPANQSVNYGATATYTVTISGIYKFTGSVALAITGLPPGETASFSPPNVTIADSTPKTATMTIAAAPKQSAATPNDDSPRGGSSIRYGFLLLPLPLLGIMVLRRRITFLPRFRVLAVLSLLSLGAATASLTGCANIGLQLEQHSYTLTIMGTSGNLQRSATANLTVQSYVTIKYH